MGYVPIFRQSSYFDPSSPCTTRLGIKRGAYLRRYAYDFIEAFAPHLPAATVERAVKGQDGSRYEL